VVEQPLRNRSCVQICWSTQAGLHGRRKFLELLLLSVMAASLQRLDALLSARRLPALDGLRAIAVLTVILYHGGIEFVPADLGVSIFFVLSGFLITWLLLRERNESGRVSLRAFYTRRALRIFPAYLVFIALSFAVDRFLGDSWPSAMRWSALTYTMNYYNALHGNPVNAITHTWSLAVEEQFYLLWPVLFIALAARGERMLRWGLVAATLAIAAWRTFLYLELHVGSAYVYNAFDTRADVLATGCLLAVAIHSPSVRAAAARIASRAWMPLVTVALLLASRLAGGPRYHYSLGFTVDALLIAVLIAQLVQLAHDGGWRWLEHPAMRYLGAISYPMYLYHHWGAGVGRRFPGDAAVADLAIGLCATIVLASGSYYVIERPFLTLKRRFERVRVIGAEDLAVDVPLVREPATADATADALSPLRTGSRGTATSHPRP
jgi:peptidoglycan/LPS O-acetylase OafA/YrhL